MSYNTSGQSSTPTPSNVGNSVVTFSDGSWNQADSTNMLQNTQPPERNELAVHNIVSVPVSTSNVSSEYLVTNRVNDINILSNQVVYNPPNFMNISYPKNTVPTGYAASNPTIGTNPQIIHGQNFLHTQNCQIIAGPSGSNQSALGRFSSQPSGSTSNITTGGVQKQKRIRTAFTSQQMMELEQEYARTRYLDRARRFELADILHLNERTIKIWFQNCRMKEKKDRAEGTEDSEEAGTPESPAEMGNIHIPMLMNEQYSGISNEVYNQGNIDSEQYPAVPIPVLMLNPSLPTSVPVQALVQSMYQSFMSEEEFKAQYQQAQMQMQPYQPLHTEVQQLAPEVEPRAQPSTSSAPSDNTEKTFDWSWIT